MYRMSERGRRALAGVLALALILPAVAGAKPMRTAAASAPGAAEVTHDMPGLPLPSSGSTMTLDALEQRLYNFELGSGQVMHVTLETADPAGDTWMYLAGFIGDAYVLEEATRNSQQDGWGRVELWVPAEDGPGTYYLDMRSWDSENAADVVLTWEKVDKAPATVTRLGGPDRYSVSALVARTAFPNWTGVKHVVVACGEDRAVADPLTAAGLAGAFEAPMLVVKSTLNSGKLPAATESALAGIRAANGGKVSIHVIGGTAVVPDAVYRRLSALKGTGGSIERISAADRYSTSAVVARRTAKELALRGRKVEHVFVANGETPASFYDALAASPICYNAGVPMVLSKTTAVPPSVLKVLSEAPFTTAKRYLVNAPDYLTAAVRSQAKAGIYIATSPNFVGASIEIAQFAWTNGLLDRKYVAVGSKLPDALTGGVAMGRMGGALLYTYPAELETPVGFELWRNKGSMVKAYALGGTSVISNTTVANMREFLAY